MAHGLGPVFRSSQFGPCRGLHVAQLSPPRPNSLPSPCLAALHISTGRTAHLSRAGCAQPPRSAERSGASSDVPPPPLRAARRPRAGAAAARLVGRRVGGAAGLRTRGGAVARQQVGVVPPDSGPLSLRVAPRFGPKKDTPATGDGVPLSHIPWTCGPFGSKPPLSLRNVVLWTKATALSSLSLSLSVTHTH